MELTELTAISPIDGRYRDKCEVLALRLAVLHNLWFYNELMAKIREALDNGTFADFREKYSGNLEKRA